MSMILRAPSYFYVITSEVEMREEAANSSKVVSQARFAEEVKVREIKGEWSLITTPDGYSGWAHSHALVFSEIMYETAIKTSRLKAHLYSVEATEYGPILSLPYGSPLKLMDDSNAQWLIVALPNGQCAFIQRGDVAVEPPLNKKQDLVHFSQKFMELPYTWGGRTSFGYDCSGFVQMLYGQIGIHLQRDAKQQILDDRFQEVSLDDLEPGDLIFFGKTDGKIGHVGMSIGKDRFIHASSRENSPWIRISSLHAAEWNGNPETYYSLRIGRQLIAPQPLQN